MRIFAFFVSGFGAERVWKMVDAERVSIFSDFARFSLKGCIYDNKKVNI
jgi:hypothetical protein